MADRIPILSIKPICASAPGEISAHGFAVPILKLSAYDFAVPILKFSASFITAGEELILSSTAKLDH
jgi:hypothetical protein